MAKVPYASAVGSLMYAMVCIRPDIAQAVGVVSRYMSNPGKEHWNAVKWILRYLRGTLDRAIIYGCSEMKLQGYCDADFTGDVVTPLRFICQPRTGYKHRVLNSSYTNHWPYACLTVPMVTSQADIEVNL